MRGGSARWLLIGNSRWHWAARADGRVIFSHGPASAAPPPDLTAWAAVGPLPAVAGLPASRRLLLEDVPLPAAPPWLGIDRALAGWQAWSERRGPVLVADAGTVLSLTRVDGEGGFAGGRLMAGLTLQLRAMAAGTAGLPAVAGAGARVADGPGSPLPAWPFATEAAMVEGVRRSLAAAVLAAARELAPLEPRLALVLTGGDSAGLLPLIRSALGPQDPPVLVRPGLCLEGLMALRPLRPGPGP